MVVTKSVGYFHYKVRQLVMTKCDSFYKVRQVYYKLQKVLQIVFYYFQDIDDCSPNPCQNGGTCSDEVNNYTCSCVAGYTGYNCSIGTLYIKVDMVFLLN